MKNSSKKSQLLITIFGGWFGLHHYLNKQYLKGALYTFTLGLFYFGWFYDIFKAATAKHEKKIQVPITINVVPAKKTTENTIESKTNLTFSQDELANLYRIAKTDEIADTYIIIDVETTGLDVINDKIIELSAIKYVNNKEVETFSQLINPVQPISQDITRITGITNEDLMDKPTLKKVLPDFIRFIGSSHLVAHNASYDYKILASEFNRNGVQIPKNRIVDTLSLAKKHFTKDIVPNYKLVTFKKYFGLTHESHRALADCYTCAKLYQYCLNLIDQQRPQLNDDEIKTLSIVNEILLNNGKNTSMLRGQLLSSNVLGISIYGNILKIKCRGKLKYILLPHLQLDSYDLSKFDLAEAKPSDKTKYRLLYSSIDDIYSLEKYICDAYDFLNRRNESDLAEGIIHKKDYEEYLNTGYKL